MSKKVLFAGGGAALVAALALLGRVYLPLGARGGRAGSGRANQARRAKDVAYVDVKELTLRLADASVEHYIRLSPVLAVLSAKQDKIEERIPVVRDRIVTVVTAQTSSELATPDGERQLKKDLLRSLHEDFGEDVVDIYFSGYLVE